MQTLYKNVSNKLCQPMKGEKAKEKLDYSYLILSKSTNETVITKWGKGKWKLLPEIEEITEGQAHENCIKIFWQAWPSLSIGRE